MATNILKFFLYAILILCLMWLSIIAFGPRAISSLVHYYSESKVSVQNLKVSPKLKIMASRVDFKDVDLGLNESVSGFLRAFKIDFSEIFTDRRALLVSTGPSSFGRYGSIEKGLIKIDLDGVFSTQNVSFDLSLSEVVNPSLVQIANVFVKGELNFQDKKISTIEFSANQLASQASDQITAEIADGSIDYLSLDNFPYFSNFGSAFEQVKIGAFDVTLHGVTMIAKSEGLQDQLKFNIEEAESPQFGFAFQGGEFDLFGQNLFSEAFSRNSHKLSFELKHIYSTALDFLSKGSALKNLQGSVQLKNGEVTELVFNGMFDSFQINSQGQFIADASFLEFKAALNLDNRASESVVNGSVTLNSDPMLKLYLTFNVNGATEIKASDLIPCLKNNCITEEYNVYYEISVGKQTMKVESSCPNFDCLSSSASHVFMTTDTDLFFNELIKTKILNPLVAAYAFSQMRLGIVEGNGHTLKY